MKVSNNSVQSSAPMSRSKTAHVTRPENVCLACKKENHPLNTCGKFQGMSRHERSALVKRNGYCMNCQKAGHMASKCRSYPACKKCHKAHHTLLHIDTSKPPEESNTETASSATHVPQPKKGSKSC